jgi:hypothetical protein
MGRVRRGVSKARQPYPLHANKPKLASAQFTFSDKLHHYVWLTSWLAQTHSFRLCPSYSTCTEDDYVTGTM